VSDPNSSTSNSEPEGGIGSHETPEADSEPIDVTELLESTRKLFPPEDLQRAMEQAGYTPEPPINKPGEPEIDNEESRREAEAPPATLVTNKVEPETARWKEEEKLAIISSDSTTHSEANGDDANGESTDEQNKDKVPEGEPPLTGFNVLSIVAFVLALALSPLAVIFGYVALGQTRRARQRGETLALWAIGLGWLVFAAWAVVVTSLLWIANQQGITVDSFREFIELFSLP